MSASFAFLPNVAIMKDSSTVVMSSPRSIGVPTSHITNRRLAPSMRNPRTKLPFDERFSRPNRQSRPNWEPPTYDPIPENGTPGENKDGDSPSDGTGTAKTTDLEEDISVSLDSGDGSGSDINGTGEGGNGGSGDNGGNDENDGNEGEHNELSRLLRLTEAESKRASLAELRSLQAASRIPLLGWLALRWPALRDRLAANPRFGLQMGVELTVGLVTKSLAEVQVRGERFWKEFDFYLSDMALELFGDAMLVFLLSPSALIRSAQLGFTARLPSHFAQVGSYSLLSRATGFSYKAIQFGLTGFFASVVGHGLTRYLVSKREKGSVGDHVQLAPILPTSVAWGCFMLSSSNARYQMVNGIEQRLLDPILGANAALLTAVTFALRFGNCYLGGLHWLPWAKEWGIQ